MRYLKTFVSVAALLPALAASAAKPPTGHGDAASCAPWRAAPSRPTP